MRSGGREQKKEVVGCRTFLDEAIDKRRLPWHFQKQKGIQWGKERGSDFTEKLSLLCEVNGGG